MRRAAEATYVLVVAVVATCGFAAGSTALILLAFALTLPAGAVALVGFYVVYGLLTQVSGVDPAATAVLGVLATVVAAVLDIAFVRLLQGRRRRGPVDDDSPRDVPAC